MLKLVPGGPADKSGRILVGDRLTHVDGAAIAGLSLPQQRDLILGCGRGRCRGAETGRGTGESP